MRIFLFSCLVIASGTPARAQIDPSSASLLGSVKASPDAGLRSGRYESSGHEVVEDQDATEPKPAMKQPVAKPQRKQNDSAAAAMPTPRARTIVKKQSPRSDDIPTATIQPKIKRFTASAPLISVDGSAPPEVLGAAPAESTPVEHASEPPKPESPESEADLDRPRDPLLGIELLSGLVYEDARSNSTYRAFSSTGQLLGIGLAFWINPHVGFSGRYQTTMAADMASATDGNQQVPFTQEWSELRWNFRKHLGGQRKTSLEYGFVYAQDSLRASSDATSRASLLTSGVGVSLKALLPSSRFYTWTLGGNLYPRMNHSESATAIDLQSGSDPQSTRLDLSVGGDYRLEKQNALFWDLSMQLQKTQFGGSSNTNEPNGAAASGVSVLTNTLFFHLGYRWGG